MYADDAALVVSGLCIDNIENTLSSNIESLSIWLEENRLSLHLGKTESILFASQKKLKPKHIMNIKCKGKEIEGKKSVKYLGVTIDQDMSCKSTGNNFLSKINNRIKFLHRKASFFRFKERKIVSTALVQSHFDYACNVWYRGLSSTISKKFQICQNKIVRFILDYDNRKHLFVKDFDRIGILDVRHRIDYITLCNMYNVFNLDAPSYIIDMIKRNNCEHDTRSTSDFVLPSVKSQGKKTFCYCGVKLWNSLKKDIRYANSKHAFKDNLKSLLLNELNV